MKNDFLTDGLKFLAIFLFFLGLLYKIGELIVVGFKVPF